MKTLRLLQMMKVQVLFRYFKKINPKSLTALGLVREILGSYSAFGYSFAGADSYPILLFIMPPGAFLALAGLILLFNKISRKGEAK